LLLKATPEWYSAGRYVLGKVERALILKSGHGEGSAWELAAVLMRSFARLSTERNHAGVTNAAELVSDKSSLRAQRVQTPIITGRVSRSQIHLVFSIICDSADVSQARTTRSDHGHVT